MINLKRFVIIVLGLTIINSNPVQAGISYPRHIMPLMPWLLQFGD